jgi:transposase
MSEKKKVKRDLRAIDGERKERPDSEVAAKPERRRFTAAYKLRILEQVEVCRGSNEIGALLRREGLYSSNVSKWRMQRDAGALRELSQKRGRKPKVTDNEKERLERENARLRREVQQLRAINEIQKKVSNLLGLSLDDESDGKS